MPLSDLHPYLLTGLCAFAVMGLPQCLLLMINRLYNKNLEILTFPEKLHDKKRTTPRDMMFLVFSCLSFLAMLFILPPTTLELFLLHTLFVALLLVAICTDLDQQVIFDAVLLPLAIGGILFTLFSNLPLIEHLSYGLGTGAVFLLLSMLTRGGIGGGDIKLMSTLGLWLGQGIITASLFGIILGGIAAFLLLITKRLGRKDYFAYGPYLAIGGLFSFLLQWSPIFQN